MNFGDWPAWIALAVAILSPVATLIINNIFQLVKEKNEREVQLEREEKEIKALFLSELYAILTVTTDQPVSFSARALQVVQYCDEETQKIILGICTGLPLAASHSHNEGVYGQSYLYNISHLIHCNTLEDLAFKLTERINLPHKETEKQKSLKKAKK